jgi:tetraacyldisaccharide 4'-kinase
VVPDAGMAAQVARHKVLALSGIGQPDKFKVTLEGMGAIIVAEHRFADHSAYTPNDIEEAARAANALGAIIVTTQKDQVKLAPLWDAARHGELHTVPITLKITEENVFLSTIEQMVRAKISASAS